MNVALPYQLLADLVLCLHFAFVVFVVLGLVLVVAGNLRGWRWVNSLWFRVSHLAAIFAVVMESWFGVVCPLTDLEMWLRTRAQATTYTGSFIEHWVQDILFYSAPTWVFALAYTAFGVAVAAAWWYFPPRRGSVKYRNQL
jgi:hypothetical protein